MYHDGMFSKPETQLVGSDFSTNTQQAQQHAEAADGLFALKDPDHLMTKYLDHYR
jgi:hypothetical protein